MNLGFIGLGDMGSLIVPRLMAAGHEVTGWNRTKSKPEVAQLTAAGMSWADTPAEVAAASEVVFSCLTNGAAVKACTTGKDGVLEGLAAGSIHIDMSTISPDVTRECSAAFAKAGRIFLDGPISGSPVTVKAGQASIMIGGDKAAFERLKDMLTAIGPKVSYLGPSGMATTMKISVNLLLMVEIICFGEAVALAEKGGVDRTAAVDAILKSVAASPVIGYRGPFILEGNMPAKPLADVTLQQKDMVLALDLARKLGQPTPLAAAANEMMNACRGLGIDHNDFVVAFEAYRKLGGAT
jgi:3-hydroxyisobutyrate dehydrogenase-like beta-hydroxyacid dehydrogenase